MEKVLGCHSPVVRDLRYYVKCPAIPGFACMGMVTKKQEIRGMPHGLGVRIGKKEEARCVRECKEPISLCISKVSPSSGSLEQETGDARGSYVIHKWCLIHKDSKTSVPSCYPDLARIISSEYPVRC